MWWVKIPRYALLNLSWGSSLWVYTLKEPLFPHRELGAGQLGLAINTAIGNGHL